MKELRAAWMLAQTNQTCHIRCKDRRIVTCKIVYICCVDGLWYLFYDLAGLAQVQPAKPLSLLLIVFKVWVEFGSVCRKVELNIFVTFLGMKKVIQLGMSVTSHCFFAIYKRLMITWEIFKESSLSHLRWERKEERKVTQFTICSEGQEQSLLMNRDSCILKGRAPEIIIRKGSFWKTDMPLQVVLTYWAQ